MEKEGQENSRINNKGEHCSTVYMNYNSLDNGAAKLALDSQIACVATKKQGDWQKSNSGFGNSSPLVNLEITKQPVIKLEQQHPRRSSTPPTGGGPMLSSQEWDQMLERINPIHLDEWSETSLVGKVAAVLGAPLLFIVLLTVPVVDSERRNNNWCRPLNALHCITIPLVISMSFKFGASNDYLSLFGAPLPLIILIPAMCVATFVLKTSEPNKPPKYHSVFAYFGFIMSVLWIYMLASEIISLLKTIGIMFSMSDTAIGLGVLAWGNSLGDIVANLSLAEAGYPRMAIGAAIGAPLLNLLLGFGISLSLNLKPDQILPFEYSPTITLLCSTLAIILLSLMLSTLAPVNWSKKPFGYLLIGCYCVYFIIAVCLEYNFIKFN